jgi:hypothetical protein
MGSARRAVFKMQQCRSIEETTFIQDQEDDYRWQEQVE